jgi:uncharacterized SAM-binding protein YcdF (DUF218 family)
LSSQLTDCERFVAYLGSLPEGTGDALVLFQGDGLARVPHAIQLFKSGAAPFVILVGGADNRDYGSYPSRELYELLLAGGVPAEAIEFEATALHTRAEIDRAIEIAHRKGWRRLLLVSSPYHMFRVILSFAAAIQHYGYSITGYPATIRDLPLFKPNAWGTRADLYDREFARIATYQSKGDVASFADGLAYLRGLAADA